MHTNIMNHDNPVGLLHFWPSYSVGQKHFFRWKFVYLCFNWALLLKGLFSIGSATIIKIKFGDLAMGFDKAA